MTFRGTRSGAKYRNFAIALALFASMLVVFAFTFIASTTRLHADSTVNNIDTWGKLAKAISDAESESGLTTIKITNDLVASSQIVVNNGNKIKIVSDSNKKIYRKKGDTNFSVFKVNGELELAGNVHMTGATADAQSGSRNVIIKDGVGNEILRYNLNDLGPNSTTETLEQLFKLKLRLMGFSGSASSLYKPEVWEEVLREKLIVNPTNPHNPYKLGYKFNESNPWTVPSGLNMYARLETITGDVTILANWTPSPGTNGLPNYTITDTPSIGSGDGAINTDTINNNAKYTKVKGDAANNANLEHFAGKVDGETNDLGFFVQVGKTGKFKISGDVSGDSGGKLENFKTIAHKTNSPREIAPVFVEGEFEMTGGAIENNEVSYLGAIEETEKSKLAVKAMKNYLKNKMPMTNSAGGVIFKGEGSKGNITGGKIRKNKGDSGGIIVADGAQVTLGEKEGAENKAGINRNIGFHHAGAALVENGGTLFVKETAQMYQNVTWAKGGAIWATRYGTRGYVNTDWSKWPKEYPTVADDPKPGKDGNVIMTGGNIRDNTAFVRAGAIEVESNGVQLLGGKLYENKCRSLGGAIYVEGDAPGYTFTLVVEEGYIHSNKSVRGTAANNSDEQTINRVLDRNLKDGALTEQQGSGYTVGNTQDSDFTGAWGNGGGVWLCPVGGTSLFAGKDVVIKNNTAYGHGTTNGNNAGKGGTDFFLSRGNGAALIQGLHDDWYTQAPDEKLNLTETERKNGKILKGSLRLVNNSNSTYEGNGIKIYDNWSRDGGGIASNGTVLFGKAQDVNRYDAKLQLEKYWSDIDPAGKEITFELYYKPEEGEKIKLEGYDLKLNGSADQVVEQSEHVAIETTGENDTRWRGSIIIPSQYKGKPLYLLKAFKNGSVVGENLDPTNLAHVAIMHDAIKNGGRLEIQKWFIEIKEAYSGYKVEIDPARVEATNTDGSEEIPLVNYVEGTTTKSIFVNFTNVVFSQKVTNKPANIEVPVKKVWKDQDGNIMANTKHQWNANNKIEFKDKNNNSVYVNWPKDKVWALKFKLYNQYHDGQSGSVVRETDREAFNIGKIADAIRTGQRQEITANSKMYADAVPEEYYIVKDNTGKIVYTISKTDAEGKTAAEITNLAKTKLEQGGYDKNTTLNTPELVNIYFPVLVFADLPMYDSNHKLIPYAPSEPNVGNHGGSADSETYDVSYEDHQGNDLADRFEKNGSNYTIPNSELEQYVKDIQEHGLTVANDQTIDIKINKKWLKADGTQGDAWDGIPQGSRIEFQLVAKDEEGKWKPVTGQTKRYLDRNGNLYDAATGGNAKNWDNLKKYDSEGALIEYGVKETVPDGYIYSLGKTTYSQVGDYDSQQVEVISVKNHKATSVEATKTWRNSAGTISWPAGLKVKFYLMRWLKVDHFGKEVKRKNLGSGNTYITVDGNRINVTSSGSNYTVSYNNKTYPVLESAYVVIEGKIYALEGGTNSDSEEKVLINPLDKNGNEITNAKEVSSSTAGHKATWDQLPYYDEAMPADETNINEWKTNHKIHYWIKEEPLENYIGTVTANGSSESTQNFKVENKFLDEKTNITAKKIWNDGGDVSSRPKIKFQLWKYSGYFNGNNFVYEAGTDGYGYWNNVGMDRVIEPAATGSALIASWEALPETYTKNGRLYYNIYAPREMVRVGWADEAKTEEVYAYTDDMQYLTSSAEHTRVNIEISEVSGGYAIQSKNARHGNVLSTVPNKTVKVLDNNAIAKVNGQWTSLYKTRIQYERCQASNANCGSFKAFAYNSKPTIEKYVNKDVHEDLETKDEWFTYDIMAYVPKWSTKLIIRDKLVDALEYATGNGDDPIVQFRKDNNHEANGSVASTEGWTTLTNGTDYTYDGRAESKVKEFVVTINKTGVDKILAQDAEDGKWVRVTQKARIKPGILDGKTKEELAELGFAEIKENDPVISEKYPNVPESEQNTSRYSHAGIKNTAKYDVTLDNNHSFENIPSNTVTVIPPADLEIEKKVTGTLGDLNKKFVFEVELTGLNHNAGNNTSERDYYYAKDKSNVVNGEGQPEAYMNEAMTSNYKTYSNGFNVDSTGVKKLWFKLKAGQKVQITGLPVDATYKVTEKASDHRPSYRIKGTNKVLTTLTEITEQHVADGAVVNVNGEYVDVESSMIGQTLPMVTNIKMKNNGSVGTALSTKSNPIGATDKVKITFTNHRDIETETGIIKDTWPWNIILLIVLVLLAYDDQMRKIKNRLRIHRISQV